MPLRFWGIDQPGALAALVKLVADGGGSLSGVDTLGCFRKCRLNIGSLQVNEWVRGRIRVWGGARALG